MSCWYNYNTVRSIVHLIFLILMFNVCGFLALSPNNNNDYRRKNGNTSFFKKGDSALLIGTTHIFYVNHNMANYV